MKDEAVTTRNLSHPIVQAFAGIVIGTCSMPDDCSIEEEITGAQVIMSVTPHAQDYPLFCGRDGRQVSSWCYLLRRAGERREEVVLFRLNEGEVGDKTHRSFVPNPKIDIHAVLRPVKDVARLTFFERHIFHVEGIPPSIRVMIECHKSDHPALFALDDIVYPYGFNQGVKLKVRKDQVVR